MGLRAGANKASAKKQPYSDFKKKTAKVGRKVKGGNVTKIEVTSKRIQIPLQSQITAVKPENEQENLGLLLKTLQHYSGPARTTALEDLKDLLSTSPSTESYLSLIFPSALELLFDDERETRKALIVLLKSLLSRFPSQSFVSVVPVTITYVCSGLTSLNKGVRRDALSLLLAIANMHSHILIPHLEKLISHSLALLVDPSQAGGQDSLGSTSTATFASSGGSVSKAKLDDSWKKGVTNRKPAESTQPSNSQRPPLLVAVLEVIDAILTSASQSSNPETVDSDSCMSLRAGSDSKQAIVLRQIRQCSLYQKGGRVHVKSSSEAGLRDDQSCSLLSSSLIADLCRRLKSVWCGLILDSSVIAAHTVDVLSLVAKISYRLGEAFHCVRTAEFQALVAGLFFKFPHSSLEASLAAPGSAREKASNLKISIIDLHLCDVALLFYESEGPESELGGVSQGVSNTNSKVNSYLMQKLKLYVEETARELCKTDENAMDVDPDTEEKEDRDQHELRTFTTSYSDIAVRLFRALEVVTLAAGRNALNTQKVDEVESSGWSMSVMLNTLRELMSAFALASAPPAESVPGIGAGITFSRRSMLATVEPTLKCLFSIASDASLWSRGYPEESFAPLAEALAVVSSLIQATDTSEFTSSSSSASTSAFRTELSQLGEAYANAMLSIVRRAPTCIDDQEGQGQGQQPNRAMDILSNSVRGLFKVPRHPGTTSSVSVCIPASSTAVKGLKTVSFYHYSSAQTRIRLLDVFAHTPFTDVLAATKTVVTAVSSASTSIEEQRYFLRIAFERRAEMGAAEFIDQLFSFLRMNITSRCHGLEGAESSSDVGVGKKAKDLSGRWLAHDIADVLVWCSSAEAPEKILSFVAPFLSALAAPALEGVLGIAGSKKNDKKKDTKSDKMWCRGWIGSYAASVSSIALCCKLLTPLLGDLNMDSQAISGAVQILVRMCVSCLMLTGDISAEADPSSKSLPLPPKGLKGQRESVRAGQLLTAVSETLCMRISSSSSESLAARSSSSHSDDAQEAAHSYFFLKSLLAELSSCWPTLTARQRTHTLNSLATVVASGAEEVVTMRLVCSRMISAAVSSMLDSAGADTHKNGDDQDLLAAGARLLETLN